MTFKMPRLTLFAVSLIQRNSSCSPLQVQIEVMDTNSLLQPTITKSLLISVATYFLIGVQDALVSPEYTFQ